MSSADKDRRITAVEALERHINTNRLAATFATVGLDFARAQAEAIDHLHEELDAALSSCPPISRNAVIQECADIAGQFMRPQGPHDRTYATACADIQDAILARKERDVAADPQAEGRKSEPKGSLQSALPESAPIAISHNREVSPSAISAIGERIPRCHACSPERTCWSSGMVPCQKARSSTAPAWRPMWELPQVKERVEILFRKEWTGRDDKVRATHEVLLLWPDGVLTDLGENHVEPEEMPTHWQSITDAPVSATREHSDG